MIARQALRKLVRRRSDHNAPAMTVAACLSDCERDLVARCAPYTMVPPERIVATSDAVAHIVRREVAGALMECGVWRGGSVLAMILTLQRLGVDDRDIYLCDTFTGMTEPTTADTSAFDPPALSTFDHARANGMRAWNYLFNEATFGLEQVREMIVGTGYPPDRIHFVVGDVEETLPDQAPDRIAVLRLDTDWYTSTKHEMEHLYPRLSVGGVLIVDDYGHWRGSAKAVDEFFDNTGGHLLLARTDYAGRMGVKV